MFDDRKLIACSRLFAKVIFAGSVFLWPVGNVFADANLATASVFISADGARANAYMDSGGTWDGNNEVTNTLGDTFSFTVQNTALGSTIDDSAFDLSISIDVASGFRLPTSPFAVAVNESPGCPAINGITATQASPGATINLNIPADSDIEPSCSYGFTFGLTTHNAAPFVTDGVYDVDFNVTYNVDDNDIATELTQTKTQNVEVRTGEIALLKTAVTTIAADGDTVEFTVSILGAGNGGVFDVVLTDILSADLTGLVIIPPASPPGAPGPAANQYTFDYIAESEIVDVTIRATVSVDPNAVSCPILLNTADAIDRTGTTSNFFDSVPFDLLNPFIDYTPPDISVPFGVAGIDVTIPVTNTGTGVAKNISISATNLAAYTVVVNNIASPNWSYAGAGIFNYSGTIAAGITQNIVFNVSANSCPPPADQNLDWIPAYQNACGTDFFPPLRFSSIAMSNSPDVTVSKTGSSGALNIGTAGTYDIALNGTNIANLPDDGVPTNLDFVVTDTLPFGITGAVINTIPATTEVLVNGVAYTAGNAIPDNAAITWRGDRADLLLLPVLRVDYTAGASGVCPVGQTITNTATVDYAACTINNEDSAGFILSESPAGGAITNIAVGGDGDFETGALDSNGVSRDEPREGELIPFTVSYSFPAGFAGTWAGTSFNAELRSAAGTGVPLVLTNNRTDVHLLITRISDGALICNLDLNPATDFTGGDGSAPLVITDFAAIAGCPALIPLGMQDHNMILTYSATSPEGNLDANNNPLNDTNVGAYLENTTLSIAAGPLSCLGNTDFIQAVNVNIERAVLDLTATINNGNPVSVCSVVPATLNVTGPALDTTADNILLQFNDANFEFVDAAGNPGDETIHLIYGGSVAALGISGSRIVNDVFMTPALNTSTVTADGTVNFNLRLRDSFVPQILAAQLDFDSKHTSPDGSVTDVDRDYSIAINGAPFAVLSGDLKMEFFPPDIILLDSPTYNFRIQIENVGTGTAVNAVYRMTLPTGMRFDSALPVPATLPPYNFSGQTIEFDLGDLVAGGIVDIDINTTIDQTTCFQAPGEEITSQNEWGCGSPIINTEIAPPLVLAPTQLTLRHDPNNSFCELCNEGEVRLLVSNTGGVLLTDVNVTENLRASGLTYVAGSTTYQVDGAAAVPALVDPVPFGVNGELVSWTPTHIPELSNLYSAFNTALNTPQEIEIIFRVHRNTALPGINEEDLIIADRNIEATAGYGLFCGPPPQNASSGLFELPIEQPAPQIVLQGRNVDANQTAAQYTDDVLGGAADDVIWRLTVANDSSDARADLEDLLVNSLYDFISESISPPPDNAPNFNITEICNSEANADLAATGASPGAPDCIPPPGTPTATSHDVDDPFGNPGNDEITAFVDTLEGGQANIYFVGKFQTLCNLTSASADIEWGCEVDTPAGGITPGGNSVPPSVVITDSQLSGSDVAAGGIAVNHTITGSNPSQPLGSKGILTITIANNANGSVRNLTLTDILPAGYALDISQVVNPGVNDELLTSVVTVPRFGIYTGMVDTATVTNLDAITFENNTTLDIALSSSTGVAPQNDLLRVGDVVTLTIRIIKISGFDIQANPDVEDELAGVDDPSVATGLLNRLTVDIRNTCGEFVESVNPGNLTVNPSPADLDITINRGDPNKTYVISNPTDSLTLDVEVTNNGGHNANNHFITVTVGGGLQVTSSPAACIAQPGPPATPRPVWVPVLPATGGTYICDAGATIVPGATGTRNYVFIVQKQGLGADLTFRADVVGEITLINTGTGLVYPPPVTNVITNIANNYSLDSIRARIIGFNLVKTVDSCREQAALPVLSQAAEVQIGEDCTYHLSAGWFGFSAPGFGQISIGNISIVDDVTAGQGFISQTDVVTGDAAASVTAATFSSTPPAVVAPNEITQGRWVYNSGSNNITDNFNIDINVVKRTRNDALNSSAPPNNHTAITTDTLDVSFQVDFDGVGGQPAVVFNNASANYPPITDRQVNVTIAEPNLVISKQVCNEDSGGGMGAACGTFTDIVQGDVNDIYTYRIQITNTAGVGTASKPAFDVVVVDTLDLLSEVLDPATDGIDNDGDGDPGGIRGGTAPTAAPARTMTFNSATTAALTQIDPGVTVDLYYRVDPDDTAVPGQQLINNVVVDYDSLAGLSGSQDAPAGVTATAAGARTYQLTDSASIDLLVPLAGSDSKSITRTTLTTLGDTTLCTPEGVNTKCTGIGPAANNIQNVSIGEEVLFELSAGLPAATYYNLVIRDTLPAGLDCIQVAAVNLNADFTPQTEPTVTCNGTDVIWNFGTRTVTALPFASLDVTFIARVENLATLNANENDVISNGGLSTVAQLEFEDLLGNPQPPVVLGPATLTIAEPLLTVNQSFAVANADAGDILVVTVTVTNDVTATAPAYNLQLLNDLQATGLTFQNVTTSAGQQPDAVNTGGSGNEPLFTWNAANPIFPIQPGDTVTFTYSVSVDNSVQPLDSLSNTVDISWTSLPNNNTVLNTLPSATDMREGSVPPAGLPADDYEASFTNNTINVPGATIAKVDNNPLEIFTIGASKRFTVTVQLPDGTIPAPGLNIADILNSTGSSYIYDDTAINYTINNIASINGVPGGDETNFTAIPVNGLPGTLNWVTGAIVTDINDDIGTPVVTPEIIIEYNARVNNDLTTGIDVAEINTLTNIANLDFVSGTDGPVSAGLFNVLEPVLTSTKTFTNVTPGKLPGDLPDGGDTIEYVVTILNTGASEAFDLTIVDTLTAELSLDAGFTPTVSIAGAPAFNVTPDNAPAGPLAWGQAQAVPNGLLDIPAGLPLGQGLVLTYRVVLDAVVEPNLNINNSIFIDWTSQNGVTAVERNGIGCPAFIAPNDYCVESIGVPLTVIDANAVTKVITADTYVAPPGTVRVGDTVTFQMQINIQEGLTRNISLQDAMPNGMTFVGVDSVNGDTTADYDPPGASNFSYATITAASLPAAGAVGTTTFTLGDITNTPDGNPLNDIFVIEYRARVTEDFVPQIPHVVSTGLDNTVTLAYIDAAGAPPAADPRLTSTATTTVLQPVINTLTKLDQRGAPFVTGVTVDPSVDVMQFQLQACNAVGGAPAYSLQITDDLPVQINEATITGPVNGLGSPDVIINGGPALAVDGVDYVYTAPVVRGGNMLFVFTTPLNSGQCIDINFDVTFYDDFAVNMVWNNSVNVDEYWSLPLASGQQYPAVGPVLFSMNNTAGIEPPVKILQSPVNAEATIGEEVIYRITVPGAPMPGALHNVVITDTLDPSLIFVSAADVSGNNFIINNNTVLPNNVSLQTDLIPTGQQAVIELRARVNNVAAASAGASFDNTTTYTFSQLAGGPSITDGGSDTTVNPLTIVEPLVALNKVVANLSKPGLPPDAGDILHYTLTFTASGGGVADNFSDAFDVSINDTLSTGMVFNGGLTISGAGNTIAAPVIVGDGIAVGQNLSWSLASGNADIDIAEGTLVIMTYNVVVLDSVLATQTLSNAALIQWTSIDDIGPVPDPNQRDGSAVPAVNDYNDGPSITSTVTSDNNTVVKTRLTDTFNAADNIVRIGDIIDYQLRLTIQEGTSPANVIVDTLPQGLVFEEIVSINGDAVAPYAAVAPFTHSDIAAASIVTAGDPVTGSTTVSWNIGEVINVADNNVANDEFVIVYRARVLNLVHPQVNTINLQNTANFDYNTAVGAATTETDNETIITLQPDLTVTKTAVAAGGVTVDDPTNTIIEADEIITYTIDIINAGTAPAYDTVLHDVIPVGLRNGGLTITVDSVALVTAGALPILNPVYVAATGLAVWDFDTGVADEYSIPAGDTLRIVYRVQAESGAGAGLTMSNAATATLYYSFDDDALPLVGGATGVREIYGPTNTAVVTLTTTNANPPLQISPALTATIGQPFTYRIRIPDTVMATALHDVRILEDLSISTTPDTVDLNFVSAARVAGSQPWDVTNVGNLVAVELQDLAAGVGIEVPPLETIEVDMTVVLRDQPVNIAGDVFDNTVSYTFNGVDGDVTTVAVGGNSTSAPITVLEPLDMVVTMGPVVQPATNPMTFGAVTTFTIDVENSTAANANASDAFDLTITNVLPDQVDVGMCDIPPANFTAEIRDTAGTTIRSLIENTDYVTSFSGMPACTLTITMQSVAARIEPNNHLFVTYDALLDVDGVDATLANNIAAATQWFSADTPAGVAVDEIREYNGLLSNGTPGTADEQDVVTVEVLGPVLVIDKEVFNVTSGAVAVPNVVLQAEAGDRLRYTITVSNTGRAAINDFSVTDEPDRLTSPPGLFLPGSMSNIILPVGLPNGVATDFSNVNAGANAAGILDIRTLSLDAGGGGVDSLVISFEMVIQPVVENGLLIMNQAELISPNFTNIPSDDPNFPGVIDPTQTIIGSAPVFVTRKTSVDLTGNTSVLAAGDTLRYTLQAQNVGAENSINTVLRDQIPANTSYVANSTTLNGVAVPDPGAAISPLESGLTINAPENTTAGFMRADSVGSSNIATITFDVVVATNVINGTAISNQSFVQGTGLGGVPYPDQPSDDPDTDLINDPTVDVVGNLPILRIQKTATFAPGGDLNGDDVVDNGEQLRYTFNISNTGSIPATNVLLTDAVPANSSYNANSVVVNTVFLPDTLPGTSPLIAGINVSSTPSPAFPQVGVIEPGQSATVTFEVTVSGAPAQLITNQATLDSNELPQKLSDADGNDGNGDQQTVVVIGNAQQLSISKEVSVVGGGVATAGGQLEYIITARNIGSQSVTDIIISDTLAAQLSLVVGSATMNGSAVGITVSGANITADYATSYGELESGEFISLRFLTTIDAAQVLATTINNTARVDWNAGTQNATDSSSLDVGAAPGVASVNGVLWWDANFNDVLDTGEINLPGWNIDIYLQGQLLDTVVSDQNGVFQANGLVASAASGAEYELRYRAPGAGATTASLGVASSAYTNTQQRISDIVVAAGSFNEAFNLPIDPNGIVYDSILRTPVAGATLTMINQTRSNQPVPASCFDDPNHANQTTLTQGFYKFDLNFSNSLCQPGDEYEIRIQPPANGYVGTTSVIIPPLQPVTGNAQDVPNCPGNPVADQVLATTQHCENSVNYIQPPTAVAPRSAGTNYYLKFLFNNAPVTDQIFNNHIPLDPELDAAIAISKVAGLLNVTRSQLVPYTITLTNSIGAPLQDLNVIDDFPAGFKYVAGSSRIDGVAVEPTVNGLQMIWQDLSVNTNDSVVIKMLLLVGSGVGEGEYVNRARVINSLTGEAASGVATATVRVIPDPTFDCTDIIGKVYEDSNLNTYQDKGEKGIPGVQVATARGLRVTTDTHGRFHITCAIVANEVNGSNFIMKVDDRSLPSGYRITTENPRVQRATRGKMMKFNFGASIHRVVRLDLADGVFEKGSTALRPQWQSRIDMLITELQKDASILRLSYLGENELESEVDDRLDAIEDLISDRWQELDCCYKLTIEKEVFWRKGNPSQRKGFE